MNKRIDVNKNRRFKFTTYLIYSDIFRDFIFLHNDLAMLHNTQAAPFKKMMFKLTTNK